MRNGVLIFIVMLFSTLTLYSNNETDYSDMEFSIDNVVYDYQMVEDDGKIDCVGTLEFTVPVLPDCSHFVVVRTRQHTLESDKKKFLAKILFTQIDHNLPTKTLSLKNIYWGTYFKVFVYFNEESRQPIFTQEYCSNSYIREDDLAKILDYASIDETFTDGVDISVIGNVLNVQAAEDIDLTVADLRGNLLFSGIVSQSASISLDKTTSSVVIVRYYVNNMPVTKKFIVK